MKFVMIGPKSSGKTVFLAMLQHYVQASLNCALNMLPADDETDRYITSSLDAMSRQKWPANTNRYLPKKLCWRFGLRDHLGTLDMLDAAGEDLEELLRGTNTATTSEDFAELRAHVEAADVLLYFLNLDAFLTPDLTKQQKDAFLLSQFLFKEDPAWQRKTRIVMVSKADRHTEMLSGGGSVREAITAKFSNVPALSAVLRMPSSVPFIAVSSVKTVTATEGDQVGLLVPAKPLQAGDDVKQVVDHAVQLLKEEAYGEVMKVWMARLKVPAMVAAPLLALLVWWWSDYSAPQHLKVTFVTHARKYGGEPADELKAGLYREGTDATIRLVVRGEKGETAPFVFPGGAKWFRGDPFEAGAEDTYSLTLPASVGKITEIEVNSNDAGKRGGWCLDRVEILDKEYGQPWRRSVFPNPTNGGWLEARNLTVTLTPSR